MAEYLPAIKQQAWDILLLGAYWQDAVSNSGSGEESITLDEMDLTHTSSAHRASPTFRTSIGSLLPAKDNCPHVRYGAQDT